MTVYFVTWCSVIIVITHINNGIALSCNLGDSLEDPSGYYECNQKLKSIIIV